MTKRDEARLILARTMYGEARGEGFVGMAAVANVIMNRTLLGGWYGSGVIDVVKKPWQFSAWNENDPNAAIIANLEPGKGNAVFDEAYRIAGLALDGALTDLTGGATHYEALKNDPSWTSAMVKTATIGGHEFWREV